MHAPNTRTTNANGKSAGMPRSVHRNTLQELQQQQQPATRCEHRAAKIAAVTRQRLQHTWMMCQQQPETAQSMRCSQQDGTPPKRHQQQQIELAKHTAQNKPGLQQHAANNKGNNQTIRLSRTPTI
jgi:hypothetical protein